MLTKGDHDVSLSKVSKRRPSRSAFRRATVFPVAALPDEPQGIVGRFTSHRYYEVAASGPPWIVRGDLAIRDGALVITRIEFVPEPGLADRDDTSRLGLTAREAGDLVRDVQFHEVLANAAGEFRKFPLWLELAEGGIVASPQQIASVKATAAALDNKSLRKGRQGYPDKFYRRVVVRYLELCEAGERGIYRRLAEEATVECWTPGRTGAVPEETVRSWLREAKRRQMLITPNRGVKGGFPGPNLYPKEG